MTYAHATDIAALVDDAADCGDSQAWSRLVSAYEGMLTRIGRSYHLDHATIQDAMQETWLAAFTSIGSLRDSERIGSWLATVMHRTCLRARRRSQREEPQDPNVLHEWTDSISDHSPEAEVIANEQWASVAEAVRRLPIRQQQLLTALLTDEPYKVIGETLCMPLGAIGPTRARALTRLRSTLDTPLDQAS